MSRLDDGVAGSEQVQDFGPELWRIAPSRAGPASGGELVQVPGGGLLTGVLLDEALLGHLAYLDAAAASVVAGHTHRHHGRVQSQLDFLAVQPPQARIAHLFALVPERDAPSPVPGPTRRRRLASDRPYVPAASARPPQRPPGPAARGR